MLLMGFSTGAVALGDFERALTLLSRTSIRAVELSALRMAELPLLIEALPQLDLGKFDYVSLHAPSRFPEGEEDRVIRLLEKVPVHFPIILHPDTIHDFTKWQQFGRQLAIENMDRRKDVGRSAKELDYWFEAFPKAQLCLDLAHAHQFDRTMTEAFRILRNFNDRVCQIHVSELDSTGHHYPLSYGSMRAFAEIRTMIPTNVAIIVESLSPNRSADDNEQVAWIQMELDRALEALSNNEVRVTPNEFVSPRSIPT